MISDNTERMIEQYAKGELPEDKVEQLWAIAIADPEVYERIKTEANLYNLSQADPQERLT